MGHARAMSLRGRGGRPLPPSSLTSASRVLLVHCTSMSAVFLVYTGDACYHPPGSPLVSRPWVDEPHQEPSS